MPKMAEFAIDRLSQEADSVLRTSSGTYKRGLQHPDAIKVTPTTAVVQIVGKAAAGLEEGYDSFDIKAHMLKGNTKGSGTPYVDVPFRHGAAETTAHFQGMPKDVKTAMDSAVKKRQAELRSAGASQRDIATATARLAQITPGRTFSRKLRFGTSSIDTTVQHKRGIYDDMIRTAKWKKSRAESTYHTIRRISAESAPTSWWHPGYKGAKLFKKIRAEVERTARHILIDQLRLAGVKAK